MRTTGAADRVRSAVDKHGLLLAHDAKLPSVSGIVAGEAVKGSWWGHPKGNEIFATLGTIEDEVAWVKLVNGKVTLVHRRLWPALLGVAGKWQREGLSEGAAAVLAKVKKSGTLRADALGKGERAFVSELEKRILVAVTEEHTESGHHTRVMQTWDRWAEARGVTAIAQKEARAALEQAAAALGPGAKLPWRGV